MRTTITHDDTLRRSIPSTERAVAAPASRPTSSFAATDDYQDDDDAFTDDVADTSAEYSPLITRYNSSISTRTQVKKRELATELDKFLTSLAKEWNKDFRLTELNTICLRIIDNIASEAEEAVGSSSLSSSFLSTRVRGGEELESLRPEDSEDRAKLSRIRRLKDEIEEHKLALDQIIARAYEEHELRSQAASFRVRPASAPAGSLSISADANYQKRHNELSASLHRRVVELQHLQGLSRSESLQSLPDATESRRQPPPTRAPLSFYYQTIGLESVPELPSPAKSTPVNSSSGDSPNPQPIFALAPPPPRPLASFYEDSTTAASSGRFGLAQGGKQKKGFARKAFDKVARKVKSVVIGKKHVRIDDDDVFAPSPRQ